MPDSHELAKFLAHLSRLETQETFEGINKPSYEVMADAYASLQKRLKTEGLSKQFLREEELIKNQLSLYWLNTFQQYVATTGIDISTITEPTHTPVIKLKGEDVNLELNRPGMPSDRAMIFVKAQTAMTQTNAGIVVLRPFDALADRYISIRSIRYDPTDRGENELYHCTVYNDRLDDFQRRTRYVDSATGQQRYLHEKLSTTFFLNILSIFIVTNLRCFQHCFGYFFC